MNDKMLNNLQFADIVSISKHLEKLKGMAMILTMISLLTVKKIECIKMNWYIWVRLFPSSVKAEKEVYKRITLRCIKFWNVLQNFFPSL